MENNIPKGIPGLPNGNRSTPNNTSLPTRQEGENNENDNITDKRYATAGLINTIAGSGFENAASVAAKAKDVSKFAVGAKAASKGFLYTGIIITALDNGNDLTKGEFGTANVLDLLVTGGGIVAGVTLGAPVAIGIGVAWGVYSVWDAYSGNQGKDYINQNFPMNGR